MTSPKKEPEPIRVIVKMKNGRVRREVSFEFYEATSADNCFYAMRHSANVVGVGMVYQGSVNRSWGTYRVG